MLKKMTMASMAVAAIAFAIPAMASAEWTDETEPAAHATVTFSGNAAFGSGIGGITCSEANSATTLEPGSTGKVLSFEAKNPHTKCKGTGGLGGCTIVEVEATNLPWTAHNDTSKVTITDVQVWNTMTGTFCPFHELELEGDVTATPDDPHKVSTATLGGAITIFNGTNGNHINSGTASHTLNVTPAGTYGIT